MTNASSLPPISLLTMSGWEDYALVDTGNMMRLERFGERLIARPEPQAYWAPSLPPKAWDQAGATFTLSSASDSETKGDDARGRWQTATGFPEEWPIRYHGLTCFCRLSSFQHVGLFPEQASHWEWMREELEGAARTSAGERPKLLNLFGYTGMASLVAAQAGAEVTHVDASPKAISWAKQNQETSGLEDAPIRWICDDATKFVAREGRRGRAYDGILLDPPRYGRGPKNETWRIERDLAPMLSACAEILKPGPAFVMLTAYAIRLSSLTLRELMRDAFPGGSSDYGELVIEQENAARHLSTSMFVRWTRND